MKYLKLYKLFESKDESLIEDLQDILLEINDEPYWEAYCWFENSKYIIIIKVKEDEELEGLTPPPIVIETIRRSIDFMDVSGFSSYKITFEFEDDAPSGYSNHNDEDEYIETELEEVSELEVWSNNFIRVEFGH